jgi:hypothetical protein
MGNESWLGSAIAQGPGKGIKDHLIGQAVAH